MIAIVADSSVYLTQKEAQSLGVHIVPMTYTVDGTTFAEYYSDTNGDYRPKIHKGKCTTSQPSMAVYTAVFEELRRQNYEVLCISISSRLSGAYSGAVTAAKEVDEKNIRIVDSRSTAGGMKFLVLRAQELLEENKTLEEVVVILEAERDNVAIGFTVESLAPLRKSGRIGFVRQSVGTILNIRPILLCQDGTIISQDYAKGGQQQIEKLVQVIPLSVKKVMVHHLGNESASAILFAAIRAKFPDVEIKTSLVGPVLGIHLGIPAFGVSWMT